MGFAKLAELNSYPGPKHVLDAADKLELSDEQLAATRALFEDMKQQAIALGEQLVAAETRLDQRFADGDIDAASLQAAVLEIGEVRAQLRNVHLQAHLKQKELLSPKQVQHYDMIRGYGSHHSH
jgi:Spy/CpxP family protein refolding chaperone